MNPYFLERLYTRLGEPVWFWPAVMFLIFIVAPSVMSAIEGSAP